MGHPFLLLEIYIYIYIRAHEWKHGIRELVGLLREFSSYKYIYIWVYKRTEGNLCSCKTICVHIYIIYICVQWVRESLDNCYIWTPMYIFIGPWNSRCLCPRISVYIYTYICREAINSSLDKNERAKEEIHGRPFQQLKLTALFKRIKEEEAQHLQKFTKNENGARRRRRLACKAHSSSSPSKMQKMKNKSKQMMANEIGRRISKSAIFGIGSAHRKKEEKVGKEAATAAFSSLKSDIYIYIQYIYIIIIIFITQ